MSDQELEQEWKPSGRPQSTMARSFSLALNDLFKIDNSVADLDAAVSEKKQKVSSQTSELEALEARLKATEERLKAAASAHTSPNGKPNGRSSPRPRPPVGDAFSQPQTSPTNREHPVSPLASEFNNRAPSRPSTGRPTTGKSEGRPPSGWQQRQDMPAMPGALPPTPGASEDGDVTPPTPPKHAARYKEHSG